MIPSEGIISRLQRSITQSSVLNVTLQRAQKNALVSISLGYVNKL